MVPNRGSGRPLSKVAFHTTKPSDTANISLDSAGGNLCFPATAGAPIRYSAKCRLPTRFQQPRVCVCVCVDRFNLQMTHKCIQMYWIRTSFARLFSQTDFHQRRSVKRKLLSFLVSSAFGSLLSGSASGRYAINEDLDGALVVFKCLYLLPIVVYLHVFQYLVPCVSIYPFAQFFNVIISLIEGLFNFFFFFLALQNNPALAINHP